MPEVPEADFLTALRAIVREDAGWVPTEPGASLYVRPTMIGTEAYLGVRPSRKYLLCILTSPVGNYFGPNPAPLRLWVETEHVRAARGGIGAAKAGANYVAGMAAAERAKKAGFHQVIWLDQNHRYVEEAGTMNVFFRIGDTVVTPPLEDSLLAGVTRDSILTLLREWKMKVEERPVSMAEVAEASAHGKLAEAFGTGTAATVSAIGEMQWGETVMKLGESPRRGGRPALPHVDGALRLATSGPAWVARPGRIRRRAPSAAAEARTGASSPSGPVRRARRGGWCAAARGRRSPGRASAVRPSAPVRREPAGTPPRSACPPARR